MKKKRIKLPRGVRKYVRQEKARLRRGILDIEEQERLISELYKRYGREKEEK